MAIGIIHLLEMVDVDQQGTERRRAIGQAGHVLCAEVLVTTPVIQSGQRVGTRLQLGTQPLLTGLFDAIDQRQRHQNAIHHQSKIDGLVGDVMKRHQRHDGTGRQHGTQQTTHGAEQKKTGGAITAVPGVEPETEGVGADQR